MNINELKGFFWTYVCLLAVRFLKFLGWNPRTEGSDLRREFFQFFDNLTINGERISYRQAHDRIMDGNFISKRWALAMDRLYDELY